MGVRCSVFGVRDKTKAPGPFYSHTERRILNTEHRTPNTEHRPWLTISLAALLLAWFVVALIERTPGMPVGVTLRAGDGPALHRLGAVSGPDLLAGQWWRLVTYQFAHAGLPHFGMNLLSLAMLGPFAEQVLGRWRYLAVWLVAGVWGGVAAMLVQPQALLAGASGSLWGLFTATVIRAALRGAELPRARFARAAVELGGTVALNVGGLWLLSHWLPNISNAAHIGGGLAGVAVALLAHDFRWRWLRLAGRVLLALTLPAALIVLVRAQDRAPAWQELQERQERFAFERSGLLAKARADAQLAALDADGNLRPLFEQPPSVREPEAVSAAVTALSAAAQAVAVADAALAEGEKSRSPAVRDVAKLLRASCTLDEQVLAKHVEALRDGRVWTKARRAEVKQLADQSRAMRERAAERWRQP